MLGKTAFLWKLPADRADLQGNIKIVTILNSYKKYKKMLLAWTAEAVRAVAS